MGAPEVLETRVPASLEKAPLFEFLTDETPVDFRMGCGYCSCSCWEPSIEDERV